MGHIENNKPRLLKPIETSFVLQWHITNKCENRCSHCYIPNEVKSIDNSDILTLNESKKIMDDLANFGDNLNVATRINFSGGNPLLREDFPAFMEYAKEKEIITGILGNPYPLTKENLEMLHNNNLHRYQISLDGLEKTHDSIRGKGNYKLSLDGINKLNDYGIWVSVMATISKNNYKEIPSLCEIAFEAGAKHFDFARIVPIGEGKDMMDEQLTPNEYKKFLFTMYQKYETLKINGVRSTFMGKKDPLWNLMYRDLGILEPLSKGEGVIGGCTIGKSSLCLDVDGTVYPCRRMPEPIGNIRQSSLKELFLYSKKINEYRNFEKIEGCGDCNLMGVCRGCRAVAYGNTRDYFSKDPQCWK